MGSAEEATAAASTPPPKQPAPSKSAAPQPSTLPPPPPPPATSQEPPAAPAYSADWATAVQAYYTAGAAAAAAGGPPPPFYSPPVWGSQMMSPYGTPIPYSPMYHPVYAHPSAARAPGYPAAESVINKPKGGSGGGPGKSGDGGKVTSGSADDYGSQSGGESGSEGSSDTRDNVTEGQDGARKRSFGETFNGGESSQPVAAASNNGTNAESSYVGRQRTVSKLPVSAPGRATIPAPATNLNIGMDVWGASHGSAPKVKPNSANVTTPTVGANGVMTEHQWIQDERELKRERRKQSNRESARRSRLRKQQECEDLARMVTELNSENSALKAELEQLNNVCKDLETENTSIMGELSRMAKTGIQSGFEGIDCNSSNPAQAVVEGGGQVPQNQM